MKLRAAVLFDQFAGQNEFLWARLRKGVARPELVELADELILCGAGIAQFPHLDRAK